MKDPKIFYLKNELNELHENEHVIVFDEYGDEIISFPYSSKTITRSFSCNSFNSFFK